MTVRLDRLCIWALLLLVAVTGCSEHDQTHSTQSSQEGLWASITEYEAKLDHWQQALDVITDSPDTDEDKQLRFEEHLGTRPDIAEAIDAAMALLALEPPSPRWREAAVFLTEKSSVSKRRSEAMLVAMSAIGRNDPDYEDWHKTLLLADVYTPPNVSPPLDAFFEQFGEEVSANASAHAAARYYAAMRRMMRANQLVENGGDRSEHRAAALQFARGLSTGVETVTLMRRQPPDENGEALPYPTFAEVEQELLLRLESFTVGGNLPNAIATTLDGESDQLSNYRGKVVLVDFWATWCAPCIEALPDIAELKQTLPSDAFEVVSVNTDESSQTLNQFLDDTPMPWVHWYVGENAPLLREWSIRGFPTYLLIDPNGVLLARQHGLNEPLMDRARAATCEYSEQC